MVAFITKENAKYQTSGHPSLSPRDFCLSSIFIAAAKGGALDALAAPISAALFPSLGSTVPAALAAGECTASGLIATGSLGFESGVIAGGYFPAYDI